MSRISAIWCLFILGFQLYQAENDDQPRHLECYNDYLKEINCTWNVDPHTNCSTDYSLRYKLMSLSLNVEEVTDIKTLPGSICQCSIMEPSLVFSAIYDIKVLFKGIVVLSKDIQPSQTIKPLAPHSLSINISKDKELFLVWNDNYTDSYIEKNLEYQVAYTKTGGNWKVINTTNQKMLVLQSVLDPGYTYHMKVRSKLVLNYGGVWSEWSPVCVRHYVSSDLISPALIVLVCIFVPLPVALCFFGFKLAKKSWWENVPSPQNSALSKENFDKLQKHEYVFIENLLDDCKVEKVSCTNKLPCFREKNRIENADEQPCTVNLNFPTLQHLMEISRSNEKFPFPHFPGFNFPGLTDSLSPFPLPFEDLALVASDGPSYSLFNNIAKDQWAIQEEEKYHPFTGNEDENSPLTLSTYSLIPEADSKVTGSSVQVGYKAFSSCVSAPWAKAENGSDPEERQSLEAIQTHLVPVDIESSDYMSSDKLTSKSSNEEMPDREGDKVHNPSCDFTLGTGTHFPMDPFPMFPESLQSLSFHLSSQAEPGWWQPPSIHRVPGIALSPAEPVLDSHPMLSQDCCLELEPALGTLNQGDVGQVEPGSQGNTVKKTPMKYIVVPEDAELGQDELTPYMKLSLVNVQATAKRRGVEPIHPLIKQAHLKC
ncbi:uncharacterized protein [Heterodontus francisci]|uniref:uncharacterized protein n=1 Tax=Heterodontus francisci TaxID=7792 RepID=UPI00355C42FC